jgi:hypothetical protein
MKQKVVVFDIDETLGNFSQLSIFGHVLEDYYNKPNITYQYFNDLVDLYPEIIRPSMVRILEYIRKKKNAGVCNKVMIYTNNMGPAKWLSCIRQYFETKLRLQGNTTTNSGDGGGGGGGGGLAIVPPLFDHTIKPKTEDVDTQTQQQQMYPERTTNDKTVNDFIRCGRLPRDIEICFLDDLQHPKMVDDRVYYIKLQPYHSYIPFEMFVVRFLNSALYREVFDKFTVTSTISITSPTAKKQILSIEIHNMFLKYANLAKYNAKSHQSKINPREIDEIISKYILYHLQQFFRDGPPKPRLLSRSQSSNTQHRRTSKKNSRDTTPKGGHIFYVDKTSAVKNMRNKTMRIR